jgi:2-keto-4-pentenoate hydratase/2-oxohepta-3-ene-1,7-dioic acid hydratase in catechol pathway
VNKQTRQRDLTGNMHFKIDDIISYVSKYITLNQGDLLLTGTPSGVGNVKKGDLVEGFGRIGDKTLAELTFTVEE